MQILFNNIRSKSIYFSYLRKYNSYDEIKNMDKSELNKYGYYLDFIYWLVSDEETINCKYEKLNILFEKMGEYYYNILSPLLVDISEITKKFEKIISEKEEKTIVESAQIPIMVGEYGELLPLNINDKEDKKKILIFQ